jgi:uroporphyrinogen-III synthase
VWVPVAEAARDEFARHLRNGGATVRVQQIYRSVMPVCAPEDLHAALAGGVDAITLTSGSTARHLVEALGSNPVPEGVLIVCIGEQTAADARAAGLTVAAIAAEASAQGLVRALIECLAPQPLR